jgi:4-amino-4-deoxy-L-arabinose transferase-like glycosyltransferase
VTQIVTSALIAGMASLLAGWLGGVRASVAAGVLMAIEPSSVAYSNLIMSETVFTAALLGMILLWRLWWQRGDTSSLLLLATFVGLLPLIRPVAVYLPFFLALVIYLSGGRGRARLRTSLIFLAVSLLAPAAWTARNYRVLGVPVLARVGEFEIARFAHHVEKADGQVERLSSEKQPWEDGFKDEHGYSFAEVARARSRYFLRTVAGHPVATVRLLATSGVLLLGVPDSKLPQILMSSAPSYAGGSILERLEWLRRLGILGPLLALGMVVSVGGVLAVPLLAVRARAWEVDRRWLLALLVAVVFFHVMFSSTIMWQAERYRVPVIPLLCVLFCVAAFGVRREEQAAGA